MITHNRAGRFFVKSRLKAGPRPRQRLKGRAGSSAGDRQSRIIFTVLGFTALTALLLIVLFLFLEGAALFTHPIENGSWVSLGDFILGSFWYPGYDPPEFGILPLMAASFSVTVLSACLSIPLGMGTALYLSSVAGPRVREWGKPVIELLAAIPSVVLGLAGMMVIAPLMQQWWDVPSGLNMLNASVMLALMAIPTIASIAEDALESVPRDLLEASYALGATPLQTLMRTKLPCALSGVGAGIILGLTRAMGETMVVLMCAGGAAQLSFSPLEAIRPMTSTIAAEMGETAVGGSHYSALFAIGITLFLMTFAFNLLASFIAARYSQKGYQAA
jgi:phosphate transport system permease protein